MRGSRGARALGCLCRASRSRRDARPATSACRSSNLLLVARVAGIVDRSRLLLRDLAAHLKRLDGPIRIHTERTARLLSATRAVATPDMHRVTANAVADRPA